MKIKDLTNAPAWLMNAIVSGEDVEIDIYGRVVWHGGVWHGGDWRGGDWRGGDWLGGDWRGGVWRGGDWRGGVWRGEKITRPPVEVTNLPHWHVTISDTRMEIGCQLHTHSEWAAFDDAAIVAMDRKALRFWRTYKGALLYMCAARATKEEEA